MSDNDWRYLMWYVRDVYALEKLQVGRQIDRLWEFNYAGEARIVFGTPSLKPLF